MKRYENQHQPADPSAEGGSAISLADIAEILLKGRWFIVGSLGVMLALTAWFTFTEDPVYRSASVVYITTENMSGRQFVSADVYSRKMANEFEIIMSSTMAERVANKIWQDTSAVPATSGAGYLRSQENGSVLPTETLQYLLRGMISVSAVSQGVDMFRLTAHSTSPREAAYVANKYAEAYQEYNLESSRARLTASREFLDDATREFQAELYSAESDLLRFLEREGSIAPGDRANQLVTRMMTLESAQFETQTQMGVAEAELAEIEREIERIKPGLTRQLTSADDRLIDRLNEQIAGRIMLLEERYASNPELRNNPEQDREIQRINAEIASFRRELDERSARLMEDIVLAGGPDLDIVAAGGSATAARISVLRNLRSRMTEKEIEMRMLNARQRLMANEVETLRARIGNLPDRQVILNRLDRSQQIRERLYFSLVDQLQAVRVAERSELGTVEIIDPAAGARKVSPNTTRNFQLGGIFGLLFGMVLAFGRHVLDNKVRRPEDLKKKGYTVVGVIPDLDPVIENDLQGAQTMEVGNRHINTHVVTLFNPMSPVSEAYRHLRTNIQFAIPDKVTETILVTSANPGEGKSVTAANIAVTMAEAGRRTVLLDLDLRKPSVHKIFGCSRKPGFVELAFAPKTPLDNDIHPATAYRSDVDNLFVVPAGNKVPNPAELLGSARLRELMRTLREHFDVVVIDSPPVLSVADPILLSTQADLTLMVVRAEQTDWHAIEHAIAAIEDVGGRIGGCVLNGFDAKRAYSKYAHRYGYGYGYYHSATYYGESEAEEEKDAASA
jgi:capsular exopolysaccharide synthesis family protein